MSGKRNGGIKSRLGPIPNNPKGKPIKKNTPNIMAEGDDDKDFIAQINVIICQRFVRAKVNTGFQRTRIGVEVAQLIKEQTGQQNSRRIVAIGGQRKMISVLKTKISTRLGRMRDLECVVDNTIHPKGAVLGMRALKTLGYKLVIGDRPTYQVTVTRVVKPPMEKLESTTVPNDEDKDAAEREAEKKIIFFRSGGRASCYGDRSGRSQVYFRIDLKKYIYIKKKTLSLLLTLMPPPAP